MIKSPYEKELLTTSMQGIKKAISLWMHKNRGQVAFIGSFVVFDDKGDITDDIMLAFGDKEIMEISLEGLGDALDKDKEDFINW